MVFVGAVGSSSKAILVKLAYPYGIEPLSVLVIRMMMVFPVFLLIFLFSKGLPQHRLSALDYLKVFPISILGYYLASFLDFTGLQYVPAAIERLILFTYPTLVVILSWIFLKKRISRLQWISLFLAYAGIFLVLLGDIQLPDKGLLWKGGGWIFLSAICYASYLIGSGQLIPRFGVIRFTSLAMCMASLGVFAHAWVGGEQDLFAFPVPVYQYIGWVAVLATLLPAFLISGGIKRIGASNTAIIGSVGPISTIILAYVFLDESLSLLQIIGTMVVMGGVLLISLGRRIFPPPSN